MKFLYLVALILFFNIFFYHAFGTAALALIFLAVFFFFKFIIDNKKFPQVDLKFFGLLLLANLLLITRADWFILFILIIFSALVLGIYVYLKTYNVSIFNSWLEAIISPFRVGIIYLQSVVKSLFYSQNMQKKINGKLSVWKTIARGLIFALPLVFILIQLLSAGDPIYKKFITDIFNLKLNIWSEVWERTIASAIIFVFFLPFIFFKIQKNQPVSPQFFKKLSLVPEMTVVMLTVGLTLASFIIIQFSYIFVSVSSEVNLAVYGVKTYSEYVRRGFVELTLVAFIVYAAVSFGVVVWRNAKEKVNRLKAIQLFVLFELLIFIISLFRRTYLYVLYHGWSLIRIYGGVFLIFLTFMTLTLALRHLINRKWVNIELSFLIGLIFLSAMFNAPGFIAQSSHPPTVNNKTDYVYLSRLSEDGYIGWKKSYAYAKTTLQNPQFQTSALINKEQRREIAYARYIVGAVLDHYDNLMQNFASHEEYKKYLQTLLIYALKTESNDDEKKRLVDIKNKVDRGMAGRGNIAVDIPQVYYLSNAGFNPVKNYNLYLRKNSSVKKWGIQDKVFGWNYSRHNAYKSMSKDFNLEEILSLQDTYTKLYLKIIAQPESERSFDFDISLSSPLL